MYGLTEIKQMNRAVVDAPQTRRESGYCAQRDSLARVMRRMLAQSTAAPGVDTAAETDARTVLTDIYGS